MHIFITIWRLVNPLLPGGSFLTHSLKMSFLNVNKSDRDDSWILFRALNKLYVNKKINFFDRVLTEVWRSENARFPKNEKNSISLRFLLFSSSRNNHFHVLIVDTFY
jgi:hypothetical protein